jgi:hypothetical protein
MIPVSPHTQAAADNGKRSDIKIHLRGHKGLPKLPPQLPSNATSEHHSTAPNPFSLTIPPAIMKVVASDADLQAALEFLQSALVCDPRNTEVPASACQWLMLITLRAAHCSSLCFKCRIFMYQHAARSRPTSTLLSASKRFVPMRRSCSRSRLFLERCTRAIQLTFATAGVVS